MLKIPNGIFDIVSASKFVNWRFVTKEIKKKLFWSGVGRTLFYLYTSLRLFQLRLLPLQINQFLVQVADEKLVLILIALQLLLPQDGQLPLGASHAVHLIVKVFQSGLQLAVIKINHFKMLQHFSTQFICLPAAISPGPECSYERHVLVQELNAVLGSNAVCPREGIATSGWFAGWLGRGSSCYRRR